MDERIIDVANAVHAGRYKDAVAIFTEGYRADAPRTWRRQPGTVV